MSVKLYSLFENALLPLIQEELGVNVCRVLHKSFPDGETYIRFEEEIKGNHLILIDSLDRPNLKILPMLFFAETARKLGVNKIGLITPYLSYMRQDIAFKPGESVTSIYFAKLLSQYFDWMVTVDPHLHRYNSLNEIYTLPSVVVSATESIASWITSNVESPVLIGPDLESQQWVSKVADLASIPYVILKKKRLGDRQVDITFDRDLDIQHNTPIILDDIISTATTMIEVVKHFKTIKSRAPICIGVHGVFSENAYHLLMQAGAHKIVTCNSIRHKTNEIDLSKVIASSLSCFL